MPTKIFLLEAMFREQTMLELMVLVQKLLKKYVQTNAVKPVVIIDVVRTNAFQTRVIVRSMVTIKHNRTNVLEQILVNQMWLTNAVMARVEDQMLLE
jgi:hypothetical protein